MRVTAVFIGLNLEAHAIWQVFDKSKSNVISKESAILARIACVDSVVLLTTCTCSGNKHKVRHFRRRFDFMYWIELWKLHRVRGSSVPCYASSQRVHCSLDLCAKRADEFSNRTCVFIRPTCLTLSLNKKFEATLTHDNYEIRVFKNQGVHHGKHRHQPFQKLAQIFIGLQVKIFKPREFYSQSMSRQSYYVYV